ncbi:MAG TPA: F420-0--gamma-glutamyl ligase [Clostridia bacterium]|jgi:F420-0:gamma-glutamyl ligase|nr:coenzyme F420-0:L-glutamate ligase [Clostridia bacterium]HHY06889.1 F420-0--gamma-glutamyl ligase [Clostridia bacterium]
MVRTVGTVARGIRLPIIKAGDDLVKMVIQAVKFSSETEDYPICDQDVLGITESAVARAQGNYVTLDDVAQDVYEKIKGKPEFGIVFPILSRNRFSPILKSIARSAKKIYLQLGYPADEVGNHLMSVEKMYKLGLNPYTDILSEAKYRKLFGEEVKHPFTGIDYVQMYCDLVKGEGAEIEIVLANDPKVILQYTKNVLVADVHNRFRNKQILQQAGAQIVLGLDDICTSALNGSGYNREYGLLGSNKATESKIKLFPRDGEKFVQAVQAGLKEVTGKQVEVLIYGDGAFKDPVGGIWELADPVVAPAYTKGLRGLPNEIKLKYLADNQLQNLSGEACQTAMKEYIRQKRANLVGAAASQGTTPRQLTDLLGSLCDLVSGSGDKGTPVVLIQGYFDNYATE